MTRPRPVAMRTPGATILLACLAAAVAGCGSAPIEAVSILERSLKDGLVAHWAFDDQSGTIVRDSSGNGHDGQLTGGTWVEGRFKGGLHLQPGDSMRVDDTVIVPTFPQATTDWTVSVWIKLSVADRLAFTTARAVLLSDERGSMGGWEIEFDPRPGFDWLEASYFVAPPTNDYVVLDCKCIETDRWLHFTAVFDTTNRFFTLYHDDLRVDSSVLPAPILAGAPDLSIGRWDQGQRPLSGTIDDYAIWSRTRTADEVAAVHARALPDAP
jgi:hypothetical protein